MGWWQLFTFEAIRAESILKSYARSVGIVVFFNDHTPTSAAWLYMAKKLGVNTIYVQHAPVAPIFPPLWFDAAVLHDQQSKETYAAIGPLPRKTWVVNRHSDKRAFSELACKASFRVCLYLSFWKDSVIPGILRELVEKLESSVPRIELWVSFHPRDGDLGHDGTLFDNWKATTGVLELPHIALVGNSGISFELASRGVPQLKVFEFDKLEPDYHGLVADGTLSAANIASLAEGFESIASRATVRKKTDPRAPSPRETSGVKREIAQFFGASRSKVEARTQ